MTTPKPFVLHLVTVLWGQDYADLFCQLTLRSLLAPGNLPSLAKNLELHYFVYTTPTDAQHIEQSPSWRQLQSLATVHIKAMPAPGVAKKFDHVSSIHLYASNVAAGSDAYISFLVPDCLYSDGSLGGLWEHIKAGKAKAVMTLGMRTKRESTLSALAQEFPDTAPVIELSPRKCVALALAHLHEVERAMFWDENEHTTHLSHTYFRLGPQSLLAYCWHLHPILVKPKHSNLGANVGTIDGGKYLDAIIESWDQVAIISDSDQFFSIEVSASSHAVGTHTAGPVSVRALAKWARYHGHGIYRRFFQIPIWVHHDAPTTENIQVKNRTESLIHTGIIAPVLHLSRFFNLFSNIARIRMGIRESIFRHFSGRLRRYAAGLKRRVTLTTLAFSKLIFRRSPLARNLAIKAGSFALTQQSSVTGTVEKLLIQRLENLAIDMIRHGSLAQVENLTLPLVGRSEINSSKISQELYFRAMRQLDSGKLGEAHRLFYLSREIDQTPDNAFYTDLVEAISRLKSEAEEFASTLRAEDAKERFVFSAVVWGNDYIDNFMQYTVRTLLAPGNLPSLSDASAFFSIVTTPSGAERIRATPGYVLLSEYATIVFFTFPEALTQPFHYSRPTADFYRLYGALDHTSIHFARALKAHIFFIVVDGLLSNNTISGLRKFLDDGYDICANASIVSARETLLPEMSKRYEGSDVIDISARELANIGLAHRHNYIYQRLVVPENHDFDKYPRELYFPTADGLVVHALYQHPLVISARAICSEIDFDYYIVDASLMGRILDRPEKFSRLKVVTDSNDAYVANYAPINRKFDSTGRALNADDFVSVHHHSLPIHHYIWEHQQLIRCDTMLRTHVNPQQIADAFLSSLKKKLRQIGKL